MRTAVSIYSLPFAVVDSYFSNRRTNIEVRCAKEAECQEKKIQA
jgi:hypothetical protein